MPDERYYPLQLLSALVAHSVSAKESLFIIEADILLDHSTLTAVSELQDEDCYFLYEEERPSHPGAYERKRTMSIHLSATTVAYLHEALSSLPEGARRSVSHCEPSFMCQLLGLLPHRTIRLLHQTHDARELPLLGLSHKLNPLAQEDPERSEQRRLMHALAERCRPLVDARRLEDAVSAARSRGCRSVAVYGATAPALAICDAISRSEAVVAVVDDSRARVSPHFCGKPLVSTRAALDVHGVDGLVVISEPDREHRDLSRAASRVGNSCVIVSLRYPWLDSRDGIERHALDRELADQNGYYRRILALRLLFARAPLGIVQDATGYDERQLDGLMRRFRKHGLDGCNYWVVD